MADEKTRFQSSDAESQEAQTAYHNLLESIERSMDPLSNTVLVVDDSSLVRKTVRKSIESKDDKVVVFEAEDGQKGLERLAEIREKFVRDPVFIITDLEMPVMDGWEFIENLRKDYESRGQTQGIPVIVLSASSGEKGRLFMRKSVHGGKSGYSPIVTVAKNDCIKSTKYDTKGQKGVGAWMKHFLRYTSDHKSGMV